MTRLYLRLAATNVRNGKQLYIPSIITGMFSALMFYTMVSFFENPSLKKLPGGDNLYTILGFGVYVIAFFICIFLFYTNSFIMKRRKKELAVYNILGMEKKHLVKVLFLESLFMYLTAVVGGLVIGIVFNKLLTMLLFKLIGTGATITFFISKNGIEFCMVLFAGIYFAAFIYNILQVKMAKPVELLRSGNTGEREPKTKALLAIIGAVCLGIGYYIALTTKDPLDAISLFFVAVLLVIIGTYCLFTAGSIAVLKLLRKNKKYYYQPRHFTSVSGMMYRMKQNAVGLANICILSTMVLVVLSTTVSLFLGVKDELNTRFPNEIAISAESDHYQDSQELYDAAVRTVQESGRIIGDTGVYQKLQISAMDSDGVFTPITLTDENYNINEVSVLNIMTVDDYQTMTGESVEQVGAGEIGIIASSGYDHDSFTLFEQEYPIAYNEREMLDEDAYIAGYMEGYYYILVSDAQEIAPIYQAQAEFLGETANRYETNIYLDIDGTSEEKIACDNAVKEQMTEWVSQRPEQYTSSYIETRETEHTGFQAMYGGFFFLGLFFGTMFLMVTVLIIFYKQISEGYDDKERFAIMEKVGMSNKEVKKTIAAQIRTVFLLPIAGASIHVIAAYPIIQILLQLMNLSNTALFKWCLAGTIAVFFLIYMIVFKITSRSYYRIVGNQIGQHN